jgi:protein-disulfide isomerase
VNTSANSDNSLPKKQRRDTAREHARLQRELAAKKKRRNRGFLQGGLIVGALAILAVIALVVVNAARPAQPGPLNMLSDGLLLTGAAMTPVATKAIPAGKTPTPTQTTAYAKTVNIVSYVDYQCPICQSFEATNSTQIQQWVEAGYATIEFHPIAILDRESQGMKYSSRAANAVACVANYQPAAYYAVNTALFVGQPKELSTGLTDKQLITIVQGAGATDPSIPDCVTSQKFASWVSDATNRALKGPLPNSTVSALQGTPTVIVNGKLYSGAIDNAAAFLQFVGTTAGS